jgi:hypothetical protein
MREIFCKDRNEICALDGASPAYQVEDQNYHGDHQQQVDEAPGDVEAEAQQPQDQNDCKDRPEHFLPFLLS